MFPLQFAFAQRLGHGSASQAVRGLLDLAADTLKKSTR